MKKLIIIFGLLAITALLIGQARIHLIDKPAKIEGFLNVQGNVFPVWADRYDLGTSTYVWDSVWANYLMGQIDTTQTAFTTYVGNHGGSGTWNRDSTNTWWGDTATALHNNFVVDTLDADSTNTDHLVVNTTADFKGDISIFDSTITIDTLLYLQKYGGRTGHVGLVIDIDTSANTAGNVIGIDMRGSNAFNDLSDYWIYLSTRDFWRPTTSGGIYLEGNFTHYGLADWIFQNLYSTDIIFHWQTDDKGDFIVRDGNHAAGTINNDFFQIQDSSGTKQFALANKYIRGTATFDATKTADTLVMTGVTATDYYWLQWKGSTVPTSPLTYTAAVNSLIVFCAPADTSVARASGYNWLRLQ